MQSRRVILSLLFIFIATISWILVSYYAADFMGWSIQSLTFSYPVAFLGAAVAYIMGRSHGRLREITYDSSFAGYIDLLIVVVPLVIFYLVLLQAILPSFPYLTGIVETLMKSPFTILPAWVFSFSIYRMLDRFYYKISPKSTLVLVEQLGERDIESPVVKRINCALPRLEAQHDRLIEKLARLEIRRKELLERAINTRNKSQVVLYANADAKIKEELDLVIKSQLELEQTITRLKTLRDFTEMATIIMPAINSIRSLNKPLMEYIPDVSSELESIASELNSIGLEHQPSLPAVGSALQSVDAQKILSHASEVAREKAKCKLPLHQDTI